MHNESRRFTQLGGDRKLSISDAEVAVDAHGGQHTRPIGSVDTLFVVAPMDVMPVIAAEINKQSPVESAGLATSEPANREPLEDVDRDVADKKGYNALTGEFE